MSVGLLTTGFAIDKMRYSPIDEGETAVACEIQQHNTIGVMGRGDADGHNRLELSREDIENILGVGMWITILGFFSGMGTLINKYEEWRERKVISERGFL